MPMWCPPTPPSSDGDVYVEPWSRVLYRAGAAADCLLPAPARRDRTVRAVRPRPPRAAPAPPSLFDRGAPRPRPRPRAVPAAREPPVAADWAGGEDAALRRALRLQRLPAPPPPALAPNWDWAAELVNDTARAYRSARACRDRHEALADPERARRKQKKPPSARRRPDEDAPRPPLQRLDALRDASERRRAAPKRRLDDHHLNNPKHAALLADHGVDYDVPPTPMEIATRRAERIAKEKQKAGGGAQTPAPAAAPAAAASPAPTPTPQRIVVAAAGPRADTPRRPRPAAPGSVAAATAPAAHLLYRHQAIAARHHLKILHHTATPHAQVGSGEAALRTLQLQQLALRRAAAPAAPRLLRHPAHVVVAHLAPAPAAPSATAPPALAAPSATAPAAAASAPQPTSDSTTLPDRTSYQQ